MKNFLRLAVLAGAVVVAPGFVAAPALAAPRTGAVVVAEAGNAHGKSKGPACVDKRHCVGSALQEDEKPNTPGNVNNNTNFNNTKNNIHTANHDTTNSTNQNDTKNNIHTANHDTTHSTTTNSTQNNIHTANHDTHYSKNYNTIYTTNYITNYNKNYNTTYSTSSSLLQHLPIIGGLL